VGGFWGWCELTGCELRTVRTLVRTLTLEKRRARAPRMGFSEGRTPFASGRSPNRHRCPEDS
jgi:hypothetical protein